MLHVGAEGQIRIQLISSVHPQPFTGQETETCPHLREEKQLMNVCAGIIKAGTQNSKNTIFKVDMGKAVSIITLLILIFQPLGFTICSF